MIQAQGAGTVGGAVAAGGGGASAGVVNGAVAIGEGESRGGGSPRALRFMLEGYQPAGFTEYLTYQK